MFAVLAFLFLSSASWAATYYVGATNGDNYNDGLSPSTAWKTIAKVNSSDFEPGDYILFKRGEVWREQLIVPSSGSKGNPITFGVYGSGDRPIISGAILITDWTLDSGNICWASVDWTCNLVFEDGTALIMKASKEDLVKGSYYLDEANDKLYVWLNAEENPDFHTMEVSRYHDYGLLRIDKDYIVIDGLELKHSNKYQVRIWKSNTVTIQNCKASYGYHIGFYIFGTDPMPQNIHILNNELSYNGICRTRGVAGGSGISFFGGTNWTVRGNHLDTVYGEGIECYGGANNGEISENIVQNCEQSGGIYCCGNLGSTVHHINVFNNRVTNNAVHQMEIAIEGSGNLHHINIYYNIINGKGTSGGGILVGWSGVGIIEDCTIYNNTIYGCKHGILVYGENVTNNEFKNNIYSLNDAYGWCFLLDKDSSVDNILDHNCLYNAAEEDRIKWLGTAYTLSEFQAAREKELNSIDSNPKFVDATNKDFTLQSVSPCIDAAYDWNQTGDFYNHGKKGPAWDIGAIERNTAPAKPTNLRFIPVY